MTSPSSATALDVALGSRPHTCRRAAAYSSGWTARPTDLATLFNQGDSGGDAMASAAKSHLSSPRWVEQPQRGSSHIWHRGGPRSRSCLPEVTFGVGIPVPAGSEFSVVAVDDPYNYATAQQLSLFRRMPEMANLRFLTDVMWDARETQACQPLEAMLEHQANDAALTHGQAAASLPETQLRDIAAHERVIYFAQQHDNSAGDLDVDGALGGPLNLVSMQFYAGINAYPRAGPAGSRVQARGICPVRRLGQLVHVHVPRCCARGDRARRDSVRHQNIQHHECQRPERRPWPSVDQRNVLDVPQHAERRQQLARDALQHWSERCVSAISHRAAVHAQEQRFRRDGPNRSGPRKSAHQRRLEGCGALQGAIAARPGESSAPYLHDGSAATLQDLVDFDDQRFSIGLSDSEKSDLVAFLSAL